MPRSPELNRDIRDTRRDEILAAALKLFARRGFTDTKIGDIAEAAGLSHGLVYHYFASKTAIFEELVIAKRREAWARIDAAAQEGGTLAAIEKLLENAIADARERPDVTLMITHALLTEAVPEDVRARIKAGAQDSFARSVEFLRAAQQRGEVDPEIPAEQLASTIFCCLRGLVLTCHAGKGLAIPSPTADTLLQMLSPRARPQGAARERPPSAPTPVERTSAPKPPTKRRADAAKTKRRAPAARDVAASPLPAARTRNR